MKVVIRPSTAKGKKLMAIFYDGDTKIETIHFGQYGSRTYLDHKSDNLKDNYLKRHRPNENWEDYMSAGSLARYILWNKPTIKESVKDYASRFGLDYVLEV